ncbi:type I 3-dehydroquinate dehydratase, partial [bacterium]|nr:type I 3-dehydroquinate dehydratase [bacterium]
MICATVLETSTQAILARMAEAAPTADMIEVRADAVPAGELDLRAIVSGRPRPLVLTCRPVREGGLFGSGEEERLALLAEGAGLGAETIDVEWDAASRLSVPASTRLVVSRHDFSGTLDLEDMLASLRACARADVLKVATTVGDALEAIELLDLARNERKPTIAIGMGFPGVATRLLCERSGAPWTYAASSATPAAPGQLSLEQTSRLLRGRRVTASTRALGILGNPVAHSRSPSLMNAVFATLGLDAVYSWLETSSPEEVLRRTRDDRSWAGFGVTIPHKETAARACDRLSEDARALGAVNTVARSESEWVGHNTDAPAFVDALSRAASLRGLALAELRVEVLGAGGAARAAA